MPRFRIRAPDNQFYEFSAPEGTSMEQAQAMFKQEWPRIMVANDPITRGAQDPTAGMSTLDKFRAGWGKAVSDIYQGTKQLVGLGDQEKIREQQRLDQPLMRTGAGRAGNIAGTIATYAPTAGIPGAQTTLGATMLGGLIGATTPVGEGNVATEKAKAAGLGAVAGGVTQKAMNVGGQYLRGRMATQQQIADPSRPKLQALSKGAPEGYVVSPTQVNPTMTNKLLESYAGSAQTAKKASLSNQRVTNRLVKQAIGATDDVPGTDAVQAAYARGGSAYGPIRRIGEISADFEFRSGINKVTAGYRRAASQFKSSANKEIDDLYADMRQLRFDSDSIVDKIIQLRRDASMNFRAPEGKKVDLAKIQRGIADELEGLVERKLIKLGDRQLLSAFREGRTLYAKAATADKALNPVTQNFSAKKIGGELAKKRKPLTGELRTVGEMAENFPSDFQTVTKSVLPMGPLEMGGATGLSFLSGSYGPLMWVAGRPLARGMITSGPYQRQMMSPGVGLLTSGGAETLTDPTMQYMMRSLGPTILTREEQ